MRSRFQTFVIYTSVEEALLVLKYGQLLRIKTNISLETVNYLTALPIIDAATPAQYTLDCLAIYLSSSITRPFNLSMILIISFS
jgi:hypothetical protein